MSNLNTASNPFSLMMEPERVLKAMAQSTQLRGLRRHKLHPLDKPLIPLTAEELARLAEAEDAHWPDPHASDPLDDYLVN